MDHFSLVENQDTSACDGPFFDRFLEEGIEGGEIRFRGGEDRSHECDEGGEAEHEVTGRLLAVWHPLRRHATQYPRDRGGSFLTSYSGWSLGFWELYFANSERSRKLFTAKT